MLFWNERKKQKQNKTNKNKQSKTPYTFYKELDVTLKSAVQVYV